VPSVWSDLLFAYSQISERTVQEALLLHSRMLLVNPELSEPCP
jgi:hypothetical protein